MKQLLTRLSVCWSFLACFAYATALAQGTDQRIKIESADLTFFPPTTSRIDITFDQDLDVRHPEDLNPSNITIKALPSNKPIKPTSVTREPGSLQEVLITYDFAETAPDLKDTQVNICFNSLHVVISDKSQTIKGPICGTGDILTPDNIDAQKQSTLEALKKTPKSATEKNIFASGFASKGENKDSQGGAEIHLNSNDLGVPGLFASFHLVKSTADAADAKNFESTLTYRQTYIIGRGDVEKMRESIAITRDKKATDDEKKAARKTIQDLLDSTSKRKLGAILVDFGGKFEGQALNFNVTNFVADGMVQLQSRILGLGSDHSSWKFRLIPAGIEAGKNLNNASQQAMTPAQAQTLKQVNYIARYKGGGDLNFFYNNPETSFLFKRVELDLRAVLRYLFRNEVMFNETTKMNDMTDKGLKGYGQADLKFYFASTPNGRLGFRINYSRGALPPVFAETKAFQFGFIIESADDTKTAK